MTKQSRFPHWLFLVALILSNVLAPARAAFNLPGLSNNEPQFVMVDEAFPFNFIQQGDRVYLDWQVKPEYYLYQHQLSVSATNAQIGDIEMLQGQPYKDEFFGQVNIYTEPLTVTVPLVSVNDSAELIVRYQGCAKAGFCYPPEIRKVPLSPLTAKSTYTQAAEGTQSGGAQPSQTAATPETTNSAPELQTQQQELADNLGTQWWTPLLFLALGVGLAFTPCVLPMYPILTGIVLGGGKLSHSKAFKLSFIYIQGMALTYTLLGLVVASAGMQFQAALQHPYVLIGLSVMFVALALSMFGLYTIQLPSGMQTWLSGLSNKQKGGSLAGVFTMGAISGLVCSPCTTAPLSGALIYVAQSGDLMTGAIALYALAIGMGIPLILAAMFGNKLLPKAGNWMNHVKTLFGFILLAVPVFLLERILPSHITPYLWAVLGVVAFGWVYHLQSAMELGWKRSLIGIIAILGVIASVQPLLNQHTNVSANGTTPTADTNQAAVSFKRIADLNELNAELAAAKAENKPVLLDFYADWCVACKEFEKYTFHNSEVEPLLANFVLLQADVTNNAPEDIALLQELDVLGLPTIDFWDKNGNKIDNARLTGFMKAEPFIQHLKSAKLVQ